MHISIYTLGGTIDKIYFDKKSEYQVGEPQVKKVLHDGNVAFNYTIHSLLCKDSLDMTKEDRQIIVKTVEQDKNNRILITHGTDTMIDTAKILQNITGKTIVLTGAMAPAMFKETDAPFNIGSAISAVQILPFGVYIVMNGCIFDPQNVRKNIKKSRFELL